MATTIDSLEIQIEQSSDNATKGLDNLADSLGKLKNASKGGLGLTAVKNNLSKLNDSLKEVDSESASKLSALADSLEKLSKLGEIKLSSSIANGITKISQAMDSISLSSVENLEDTVAALEKMGNLGGISVPKLSNLAGNNSSDVVTTPQDNSSVTPGNVSDSVNEVTRYTDEVNRASIATGYWKGQLTQAASSISAAYAPVKEKLVSTFNSAKTGAMSFGSAIKNIPSKLLTSLATIPLKIGSAFKKAASGVASLASKLKQVVGAKIKSGLANISAGIKSLGNHSALAGTKVGQFVRSIGRIAMYRSIRFLISQFTQAIKDGANNMYQWSKIANGEFASSMDRCATSFQYLKNSIGAMVSPLINALAPVLDAIIDKLVTLINLVNQFFARLSGATTFTKAKKAATEYASAASSAGSATKEAAEEIKNATMGIDELNIISPNDDTDSSSGSGSSTPNYADMFETVDIDDSISDFTDKLKELFNAGDWEGLGRLLGQKFNELVDSVDWSGIGEKLGYYLNGAIQTLYYFMDEVDWNNLGKHFAELVNSALGQVDFNIAGRLWTKKFTAILDTIIGFLGNLNWSLVGKSFGDFLRGALDEAFDWITGYDWGEMADSAYKSLKECIKGIDFASLAQSFFKTLGAALGAAVSFIATFVADIWADINKYFQQYLTNDDGTKKSGIDWVKGILKGIWEGIKSIGTWIYDNVFTPFINGFKSAFGIHSPSTVMAEMGGYIVEGLINGIAGMFSACMAKVKEWASKVKEWFTKGEDGKNIIDHFKEMGSNIINGFKDKIATTYTNVKSSVTTWASKVKEWFQGDSEGAVNLRTFATYANNVITGFKDKITSAYVNTKSSIITWATNVKSWFTDMGYGGINNTNWSTFANNVVTAFKDKITAVYTTTKSSITTWATSVKNWFTGTSFGAICASTFETYGNNIINGFKDKVASAYTNTKSCITTWGSSIKSWFGEYCSYDKFYSVASDVVSGFKNGIGALYSTCKDTISSWGSSIISWFKNKLDVNSPSKEFYKIGGFTVEGFNNAISTMGTSTKGIVQNWADSFTGIQPQLAFAVDTSALDYYDTGSYARSIDTSVSSRASIMTTGFIEGMEEFYKEYVEPTMAQMASDMRRQADKTEKTVVQIGNRTVTDAVTTQQQANGYSFTK